MTNVLDTLLLASTVTCETSACSLFGKAYSALQYTISELSTAHIDYQELDSSVCPCCNEVGRLDKPHHMILDERSSESLMAIQFDEHLLNTLVNLLRCAQEDFNTKDQVHLAGDDAFQIHDRFRVVGDILVTNADESLAIMQTFPYDERNKVIIVNNNRVTLQLDISSKADPSKLTTVTSQPFTLQDLLLLDTVAGICTVTASDAHEDVADAEEIEDAEGNVP